MFLIEHNKMENFYTLFALFLWHAVKKEGKSMGKSYWLFGSTAFSAHRKSTQEIPFGYLKTHIIKDYSPGLWNSSRRSKSRNSREISFHRNEKMKANICLFNLSTNFYSAPSLPDTGYNANRKLLQWWREGKL